jgi:hypothetical protein
LNQALLAGGQLAREALWPDFPIFHESTAVLIVEFSVLVICGPSSGHRRCVATWSGALANGAVRGVVSRLDAAGSLGWLRVVEG